MAAHTATKAKKESGIGLNVLAASAADAGEARAPAAQNFEMKAMTPYSLGARLNRNERRFSGLLFLFRAHDGQDRSRS